MLGLMTFVGAEVWCSLTERSGNLAPSVADIAVLHALGLPTTGVSPTLIVIAILIPYVALFWGFASQTSTPVKVAIEDPAERDARYAQEEAELQHKQRISELKTGGFIKGVGAAAAATRDATAAAMNRPKPSEVAAQAEAAAAAAQEAAAKAEAEAAAKAAEPPVVDVEEAATGKAELMSVKGYIQHVQETYGRTIPDISAREQLRSVASAAKYKKDGTPGGNIWMAKADELITLAQKLHSKSATADSDHEELAA
jgi:hypothetical protein